MASKKTTTPKTADLIVVLGLKHGPKWGLRKDLLDRLKRAVSVYRTNPGSHIVVCGRWSIWYDWLDITPPVTESEMMKTYLINQGVKESDIFKESKSKDTVGNAYYLKLILRNKPQYKKLIIICAEQHARRVRFLFKKFFGAGYDLSYLLVPSPRFNKNVTGDENICLKDQKKLLRKVRAGHEQDFVHKLYKSSYYSRQAKLVHTSR